MCPPGTKAPLDPLAGVPTAAADADLRIFLEELASRGDVVRFRHGGREHVLVNDPPLIHEILAGRLDGVGLSPTKGPQRLLLGDGLLTTDGPHWRPRRVLVQRELSHRNVRRFGDGFAERTSARVARWIGEGSVDLQHELEELTLDNLGAALFTSDFEDARPFVRSRAPSGARDDGRFGRGRLRPGGPRPARRGGARARPVRARRDRRPQHDSGRRPARAPGRRRRDRRPGVRPRLGPRRGGDAADRRPRADRDGRDDGLPRPRPERARSPARCARSSARRARAAFPTPGSPTRSSSRGTSSPRRSGSIRRRTCSTAPRRGR